VQRSGTLGVQGRCAMTVVYRVFSYFGLLSIFGALLFGFRHDPTAPWRNYLFNLVLYGAWVTVHLLMTTGAFKRAVYGARIGSPIERQVYIAVTVVTWLTVLSVHRPVPGVGFELPEAVRFAATVGFLFGVFAFFEGATFGAIDGILGVPGTAIGLSHGRETPLLTEGQYARVRHPMYRAAIGAGLCGLLLHPNTAQLLWTAFIGATFIAFIPTEEARLLAARGEAYQTYMQRTPWRLARGIW
jgi:protein-S-isoprenylcysteine O-methyltransferase Ste14